MGSSNQTQLPNSNVKRWCWLITCIVVVWLLFVLKPILMPFVMGALLAYLSNPAATWLERHKVRRTFAALLVMLVFLSLLALAVMILVPLIQGQLEQFIQALPQIIDWVTEKLFPWLETNLGVDVSAFDVNTMKQTLLDNWQQAGMWVRDMVIRISRSSYLLILWLANLVLIPVVMFYLLRDGRMINQQFQSILPGTAKSTYAKLLAQCDEVLSAFIRGQLIVMVAIGIVYSVGLWLAGLNFALLVGIIAGLFTIVPYLGFAVGLGLSIIMALVQFDSVIPLLWVLLVFAVGHVLENMILTPLLIGDKIGLHPVAVIFAVLAGGHLLGFVGVLLALPIAAVIMVLIRHFYLYYLQDNSLVL